MSQRHPPLRLSPEPTPAVLSAVVRNDFASFVAKVFQTVAPGTPFLPNWHIDAIAWQLEEIRLGRNTRLTITLPPRSLKSIISSVAFPAFVLGHDPTRRIIAVSYSSDLALKHANDFRAVMRSRWYRDLFPGTAIDPAKDNEIEVQTTARGGRLSTSVGGTLTGRGGSLIIIDDPLKPADAQSDAKREAVIQWYANTLLSRLDDKRTGAIVIAMQRVHAGDLVGHLLGTEEPSSETELPPHGRWTHLNLPAIAEVEERIQLGPGRFHRRLPGDLIDPRREPKTILDAMRRELGSDLFAAQYQQSPVPPGGLLIKRCWFNQRDERPPARRPGSRLIQSWDTATKLGEHNDWSVCTNWLVDPLTPDSRPTASSRTGPWHLIEVVRARLEYPDLLRMAHRLAARDEPDAILIEDANVGTALVQDLKRHQLPVIPITPTADKVTRLTVQSARLEAGLVALPSRANWLPEFEAELFAFPQGRHDDQVDSVSQFVEWVARPRGEPRVRSL